MDVFSLQKLIVESTKKKEKVESRITELHVFEKEERERIERTWGGPKTQLENALKLLRIESESLTVQILARKKELGALEQLHGTVHESHGKKIAEKKTELVALEAKIEAVNSLVEIANQQLDSKNSEIVSLTKKIETLSFELENYNKTILVASNQLKELMANISSKSIIAQKLNDRIRELKRTHHIVVEDVVTERTKRLYKRHKQLTGMNKALDVQIERKRKLLK